MGRLSIIGLICSGVSLGFIIISTAIPYWAHMNGNKVDSYIGLWTSCTKSENEKDADCQEQYKFKEYVLAVRAFVLLGLFQVAIAAILAIIRLFSTYGNAKVSIAAGVLAISAGVCMLIAVIIWGTKTNEYVAEINQNAQVLTVQYHAGLALAVIGAVAALGAGILFIIGKQHPMQT